MSIQWNEKHTVAIRPHVGGDKPAPNAVVAQDGSGQFKTIMEALNTHPGKEIQGHFVIHVKAGIYQEEVRISKTQPCVYMYGDGPTTTIVTGNKNYGIMKIKTSETAPFHVEGHNFFCRDMGFQNTAGPDGHQAVALRVNSHHAVFLNCRFDAYQDTLYCQGGSHFFRDCEILGTIDFIFGNGATLIQNSRIIVRKPGPTQNTNVVTAQGRDDKDENTALVIQGCTIMAEPELMAAKDHVKTYLGRPWKRYAHTHFIENEIGDFVVPEAYEPWQGENFHETAIYGEYNNRGPGANTQNRSKWPNVKVLSKEEAEKFTAAPFLRGAEWVTNTGIPIHMGLTS